jgi:hypothetical protein
MPTAPTIGESSPTSRRWNCFSNGSNNICQSKLSTVPTRTP